MTTPIRVLLAKVGLDGHDRGVKVVARTLRDAGMDVIYSGLHRTPEEVVNTAIQEDVDVLGVSLLSGVQLTVFPKIFKLLADRGANDLIVIAGGVMPDEDAAAIKQMGVREVLLQDTPPQAIVDTIEQLVAPAQREQAILARLQEVCAYAYAHAPFYRRRWDEAGFHPRQLKSLEDFENRVPVVRKADLRAAQTAHPPFGDYLCVPDSEVFHVHGTSGTTGRPTAFGVGRADWRTMANAHARIMWGMGLRPGDMICVAAVFSLYLGSWGALAGAERLHAKAFPFGAGAPGMSARLAQWLHIMKPAAFYGTPSYAIHLAEVAREEKIDPREFRLKCLFFSGEPGASVPGVNRPRWCACPTGSAARRSTRTWSAPVSR